MLNDNITYAVISILIVLFLTPLVISLANKTKVVAAPSADRWHSKPTPLLGGISIIISITFVAFISGIYHSLDSIVLISILIIFLSGLYDDIWGMLPYVKLLFQIIASSLIMASGIVVGKGVLLPDFVAIPLTIFWIVGITNAMNLLDNMDGLCSGTSFVISSFLGLLFYFDGQNDLSTLSILIAGANLGFLYYNFKPAKIFMGDSGSLTLGFLLSLISLMGTFHTKSHILFSLGIPVILMSIPIFDTTLVTISRKYLNRPISQGGKDHLSHRLIALGYSEHKSLILMYGISTLGGLIALGIKYLDVSISLLIILLTLILFIGFGAMLSRVRVYTNRDYSSINSSEMGKITAIRTILIYKRQIIEVVTDSIIVIFSIYFSIWLQYEGTIPETLSEQLFKMIIVFYPFSILVFFLFRFYNTIWRYLTIIDAFRYLGAVIFVSFMLDLLSKYFYGSILNYTTIIIFAFVLFVLISAFRLSERMIGILIKRSLVEVSSNQKGNKRALIIGAGDRGIMALKEILQNRDRMMTPVGFLDDDISKKGARIEGFKILGDISKINYIIKTKKVDKILIAIGNIEKDRLNKIQSACRNTGKKTEIFSIKFSELSKV